MLTELELRPRGWSTSRTCQEADSGHSSLPASPPSPSWSDMGQYDFSLDLLGEEKKERRAIKGSRWNDAPDASNDSNHIDGFSTATSKSMIKKHFP